MTQNNFMALLVLTFLRHSFKAEVSFNKEMCHLTNRKGNGIYVSYYQAKEMTVEISVYKQTATCLKKVIEFNSYTTEEQAQLWINQTMNEIIEKLKLKPHEYA